VIYLVVSYSIFRRYARTACRRKSVQSHYTLDGSSDVLRRKCVFSTIHSNRPIINLGFWICPKIFSLMKRAFPAPVTILMESPIFFTSYADRRKILRDNSRLEVLQEENDKNHSCHLENRKSFIPSKLFDSHAGNFVGKCPMPITTIFRLQVIHH
jgi:hypothetical protein